MLHVRCTQHGRNPRGQETSEEAKRKRGAVLSCTQHCPSSTAMKPGISWLHTVATNLEMVLFPHCSYKMPTTERKAHKVIEHATRALSSGLGSSLVFTSAHPMTKEQGLSGKAKPRLRSGMAPVGGPSSEGRRALRLCFPPKQSCEPKLQHQASGADRQAGVPEARGIFTILRASSLPFER